MDAVLARKPPRALSPRALHGADDARLVAEVRAGSRSAFEAVYDRHHAGILAFCRHMLGSREEAEDVVQQTFTAAYRALRADDRAVSLKAWLYAIARNGCITVLRVRRETVALDDAGATALATAGLAAEVERREDLRTLLADVQQLPDDQRAALILAELGAHSHDEIALILGVPTPKIKALVFQAREALMSRRLARDADCGQIREQLSIVRGGARRRGELRHHVAQCAGCRAFDAEVRRQRAGLAVLLPVAPTLALKHSALAAAFAAGGSSVAPAGGAAAGGGLAGGATTAGAGAGGAGAGGVAATGGGAAVTGTGGAVAGTATTAAVVASGAGVGSSAAVAGGGSLLFGAQAIGVKAVVALALTGLAGGYTATHGLPVGHKSPPPALVTSPGHGTAGKLGAYPSVGAKAPLGAVGAIPPATGTPARGASSAGQAAACSAGDTAACVDSTSDTTSAGRTPVDLDGDGLPNREDRCPRRPAGTSNGCPGGTPKLPAPGLTTSGGPTGDRDGDGIPNRDDKCPARPAAATASGCPGDRPTGKLPATAKTPGDRDGDGIPNRDDKCPGRPAGTASGCPVGKPAGTPPGAAALPDRDNDGIPNRNDKCPARPGPAPTGCPDETPAPEAPAAAALPDRDNDGVPNRDDKCPARPGPAPTGCPDKKKAADEKPADEQAAAAPTTP